MHVRFQDKMMFYFYTRFVQVGFCLLCFALLLLFKSKTYFIVIFLLLGICSCVSVCWVFFIICCAMCMVSGELSVSGLGEKHSANDLLCNVYGVRWAQCAWAGREAQRQWLCSVESLQAWRTFLGFAMGKGTAKQHLGLWTVIITISIR